jgi:hypothetical protein
MLVCLGCVLFTLGLPSGATAFESTVPGHRIHDGITREAARAAGFDNRDAGTLAASSGNPDLRETLLFDFHGGAFRFLPPNPKTYRANHHFDRGPGTSHAAAFAAGVAYVRERRARAIDASRGIGRAAALKTIAQALHALEDFFSHSNFVDLPPDEQAACVEALRGGGRTAPTSLKITSYFPLARNPEKPEDPLRYTHGTRSKDAGRKNADAAGRPAGSDRTRFALARAAATAAATEFLLGVRDSIPK